ncbi:MAG: prepilin-type N-terminal cleavage/methylation domain-containing protein [Lachnospiraceae bacterium]|nr:prepilin-type N-terminal cleavage/methylation domain-containing protein [Lachnospiraceae bacterium]
MKKEMNNKGFSLVELIIVVAIMAVLIGVLAPAYLQYVEKSKKTKDCSAVGSIMDAMEIVASDPAVTWPTGESLTVTVTAANATYAGDVDGSAVEDKLTAIVDPANTQLTGSWAQISFEGVKNANGTVDFTNETTVNTQMTNDAIGEISPALEARLQ